MRRMLPASALTLALAFRLAAPLAAQEASLPTLAVLPLKGQFRVPPPMPRGQGYGQAYGQRQPQAPQQSRQQPATPLADQLDGRVVQAFFNTHRFRMIERSRLEQVLKEGQFQQSGLVDDAQAVKLGRQLGAQFVAVGSYSGGLMRALPARGAVTPGALRQAPFQGSLEMDLRVVGTESGAIVEVLAVKASLEPGGEGRPLVRLMDAFSAQLEQEVAAHFPLQGYLIQVNGELAVIDLGTRHGIKRGDVFRVLVPGPEIIHPVTGAKVKGAPKAIGEVEVTEPGEESSTARLTRVREPFRPGMMVESRKEPSATAQPAP